LEDNNFDKHKFYGLIGKNKWVADQERAKGNIYMVMSHLQMA